jgi:quercetin dioxygenase-like cupin family protein
MHIDSHPAETYLRFDPSTFRWVGVPPRPYKPGSGHRGVSRHVLASAEQLSAAFELRYFEIEPGGYSTLEKHRHAHFVLALRGAGRALVGEQVFDLEPFDALHVPPLTPHRWCNDGEHPFGFVCPVDRRRDRPQPLDEHELDALRANPDTAPFVF